MTNGNLVIWLKTGHPFFLEVLGEKVELVIVESKKGSVRIAIKANKDKVKIQRAFKE